jgi:hypothetical protein
MSSPRLLPLIDELIAYFNRRVMDVPDGFFDRNTRFTLNGRSFESLLGRRDDDPLIRMIARGAAGYRFAAKPLLHALDTVLVSRMDFTSNVEHARAMLALRGTLRGSGTVLDEMVTVDMSLAAGESVQQIDVMIAEAALDRIRAARS